MGGLPRNPSNTSFFPHASLVIYPPPGSFSFCKSSKGVGDGSRGPSRFLKSAHRLDVLTASEERISCSTSSGSDWMSYKKQ